jgi:hypothetical protein
MAQSIQVVLTCDLDEGEIEASETVTFGYDGSAYAFELCQKHLDEFNATMQGYIAAARKADQPGRRRRSSASNGSGSGRRSDREDLAAIREWARKKGYKVSDRGRISAEIREAFEAAQSK